MTEQYIRELLRVSVSQICHTIGYNAIQGTPMDLLTDNLHKFLQEFSRDLHRHVELYNRIEANFDDISLTLDNLSIGVSDLLEYTNHVQPVACLVEVPKFPAHKENNLNFLKPGSKEVLTRPVHIYEHLPPILQDDSDVVLGNVQQSIALTTPSSYATPTSPVSAAEVTVGTNVEIDESSTVSSETKTAQTECSTKDVITEDSEDIISLVSAGTISSNTEAIIGLDAAAPVAPSAVLPLSNESPSPIPPSPIPPLQLHPVLVRNPRSLEGEGRPTREIRSVMMTTGGFISPAIEGKLPDAKIPDIFEKLEKYKKPSSPPQQTSTASSNLPILPPLALLTSEVNSKPVGEVSANLNAKSVVAKTEFEKSGLSFTAAAALRLAKKQNPNHITPPQSLVMYDKRMLKKGSRKKALHHASLKLPLSGSNISGTSMSNVGQATASSTFLNLGKKGKRKRLKVFQKSVGKSCHNATSVAATSYSKTKASHNFPVLATSGVERPSNIEKVIKKQQKLKQKRLRQQMHQRQIEHNLSGTSGTLSTPITTTKLPNFADKAEVESLLPVNIHKDTLSTSILSSPQRIEACLVAPDGEDSSLCLNNNSATSITSNTPAAVQAVKNNTNKSTDEIKLSTEPDRTKLNIFKKISSSRERRAAGLVYAPGNIASDQQNDIIRSSLPNTIFTVDDHPLIGLPSLPSLPSGTTITATPPSGRHVYAPPNNGDDVGKINDFESLNAADNSKLKDGAVSEVFGSAGIVPPLQLMHKPKKRGRKPGSKNQPKIPGNNDGLVKKPKKRRMLMNIYGTAHGPQSAHDLIEPLNLSHGSNSEAGTLANIPLGIASTFPLYPHDSGLRQMKKEHKKAKFKDNSSKRSSLKALTMSSKKALTGAPTKEEVDSINQKLLKMDTVLQPAPPLQMSPLQKIQSLNSKTLLPSANKDISMSPAKASASVDKPTAKRNRRSSFSLPPQATSRPGSIGVPSIEARGMSNFPNVPGMAGLSMFPYYPFPSRPGLIPSHGLFPQLGQSSNNPAGIFFNGLMRFRCMNPGIRLPSLLKGDDREQDRISPPLPPPQLDGERNYCNVAPLVPDTMKFELSGALSNKGMKLPRGITSGLPGFSSKPSSSSQYSPANIGAKPVSSISLISNSPDSTKPSAMTVFESERVLPQTQTPSISTFSSKQQSGTNFAIDSSVNIANNSVPTKSFVSHNFEAVRLSSECKSTFQKNSEEEPIEVSDDSGDGSNKTQRLSISFSPSSSYVRADMSAHNTSKKYLPPSTHTDPNELLHASEGSSAGETLNFPLLDSKCFGDRRREAKKQKKNKLEKKNASSISSLFNTSVSSSGFGLETHLSVESNLIPLDRENESNSLLLASNEQYKDLTTASIMSSSTSTADGQTAFGTSMTSLIDKSLSSSCDGDAAASIGSLGPATDEQRHRDHKKLKKIKDGRIKKKKDKKDKSKTKEADKSEKSFQKFDKRKDKDEKQRDKDRLKKLKKEKKKDKQRGSDLVIPSKYTSGIESSLENATLPAVTIVPKLTLKLGSSQSMTPMYGMDEGTFDSYERSLQRRMISKSNAFGSGGLSGRGGSIGSGSTGRVREPSPELARISPLVTRPPKQKTIISSSKDTTIVAGHPVASGTVSNRDSAVVSSSTVMEASTNLETESQTIKQDCSSTISLTEGATGITLSKPTNLKSSGGLGAMLTPKNNEEKRRNLSLSSKYAIRQQHKDASIRGTASTVTNSSISMVTSTSSAQMAQQNCQSASDVEGNRVWICPACGKVDDGSAMIGCDECDAWYHWVCVGIFVAPKDNEDWFCRVCIAKKKGIHSNEKKRKRNKKKSSNP